MNLPKVFSMRAKQRVILTTMARVQVREVMRLEVLFVKPENTLAEALEVMFKARYHDILVEKDGIFQGIATWKEIMKVKPEQRHELRVEQLPTKQVSVFSEESILDAYKIMAREKTDIVPVLDREAPIRVLGVVTSETVADAYEKAKASRLGGL